MFGMITEVLNNAKNLNEGKAWFVVIDRKTQSEIIRLNTKVQLGNQGEGIDAEGIDLGEYANFTKNIRRSLGLQIDHVSFELTGEYLRSWRLEVTKSAILINVDEDRYDELVNDLRFSANHVGLTDENLNKVIQEFVLPNLQQYVRAELLR